MSRLLRIGELANLAGVSTRTVDFYTGLGLIEPAERTAGNFRLYSADCMTGSPRSGPWRPTGSASPTWRVRSSPARATCRAS